MKKRLQLLSMAQNDEVLQRKLKLLINNDWKYFFEYFLFTYDPRATVKIMPFRPWEFQLELIAAIDRAYNLKRPLLVEKSRDMGFSWCFLGWITWKMITERNFSAGIGSRKAGLVDTIGDMDSLVEKVRFLLAKLPNWLYSFNRNIHSKSLQINLPELNTSVSGEGGDNIGRGGRKSIYFIDEFAHVPRSSIVQEAVSQTSDVLIYGSTPNGKGNEFARLRWQTEIDRITLHWQKHPNKNQEWYNKMKGLLTAEQIAQEIDISYSKSTKGRVHQWFDVEKHANKEIEYNRNHPLFVTMDFGIGDPTSVIFLQDYGNIVYIIGHFETQDTIFPKIMNKIAEQLSKWKLTIGDVSGWYGDPDGRNRERISGDSIASWVWDRYKIRLRFKLPNVIKNRLQSVRLLGEGDRIIISKSLTFFVDTMDNYKFPEKEHGENDKPLHDWCSHSQSALEYYCVYEHGMDEFKQSQIIQTMRIR